MLNHALAQTEWSGGALTQKTWRGAVRARMQGVDWAQAVADVRPFLEPGAQADLLTEENLGRVLGE